MLQVLRGREEAQDPRLGVPQAQEAKVHLLRGEVQAQVSLLTPHIQVTFLCASSLSRLRYSGFYYSTFSLYPKPYFLRVLLRGFART